MCNKPSKQGGFDGNQYAMSLHIDDLHEMSGNSDEYFDSSKYLYYQYLDCLNGEIKFKFTREYLQNIIDIYSEKVRCQRDRQNF